VAKRTKPASTRLESATAVVLYHRRTGAIFATHHFAAADGANLPDDNEPERIARSLATKDGCDAKAHKALRVDPALLKRGIRYRVSVAKPALVEVKTRRKGLQPLSSRAPKATR
jgi:hypothetical protein